MISRSPVIAIVAALGLFFSRAALADSTPASGTGAEPDVFEHPALAKDLTTLLGPVARRLGVATGLRGVFIQQKQLHELPKPLTSSGDFFVARGTGVDWHTRKPFDSELVLMPQAMIQRGADGKATTTDASQQPGLQAVSQVFDALFALDVDKLDQTFALFGQPGAKGGDDWTLGLIPREPAFAKIIERIVVTGTVQPDKIVLFEASGDRTTIEFSSVVALAAVSEADRKRFVP